MTITSASWVHPRPTESNVHLDLIPENVVHALASGETKSLTPPYSAPYIQGPDSAWLWRVRSSQIRKTPADAAWIARLIMTPDVDVPVGLAGFHTTPDAAGMVEVGYQVDPIFRRRGYARRALETLLSVAQKQPEVRTVRATISPDNQPSLALVNSLGFVENGEQGDDEDGRELIFEIPA